MLEQLAAILAPVMIIPAIGYAWSKHGQAFDTAAIGKLVMLITAPCLILSTFSEVQLALLELITIGGIAFLVMLLLGACAWRIALFLNKSPAPYVVASMFPNIGNMGLPVCLFAFGEAGLALALAYFAAGSMLHFSLGIVLMSGQKWHTTLLRSPIIYAACLAIFMLASDRHFPPWALNTIKLTGQMSIPLMLFALGVSLAQLKIQNIQLNLLFSILRLAGGFSLGLLLAHLFALSDLATGVVLIQSTMPSAVFNYILAARYNQAPSDVAAIIVLSTTLSFLTLPWLLIWLL